MIPETILSILLGLGLAASVGFRVFVPLFVLSLSAHFNIIPLHENWIWIGSTTAMMTFGIATLIEIVAYLIPWVDHLLDLITIPLATIAGTLVMLATISNLDPLLSWTLAIIAGGGTATLIKSSSSTQRLASTTTTAGTANPLISSVETLGSFGISTLSIFFPLLSFLLLLFLFWILYKFFRILKPKNRD